MCVEKLCSQARHATQGGCEADALCRWSQTATCEKAPCVQYPDEKCCDHVSSCHWDPNLQACTEKYCPRTYPTAAQKADCDRDSACMWDDAERKCVEKDCKKLDDCSCRKAAECFLKAPGNCVAVQYGGCPVMDVVLILDGSGSMRARFGGPPHGCYALVE
eukprot:Sspe_Gene.28044::Locus_12480_Transcript_1_1_Confidence_1.000_Length_1641::g.28044::m.28044